LQSFEDGGREQLARALFDFGLSDPSGQQPSYSSGSEHRATLLDDSVGEPIRRRRGGADDDHKAARRVAKAMRGSQNTAADGHVDWAGRAAAGARTLR
jgi:hypothetical protein